MIRMLTVDLEKMFGNYRFYVGVVGIALGNCLSAFEAVTNGGGRAGLEDVFLGVMGGSSFLLILMLCVIGGGFSFCEEQKNGNIRLTALRAGVKPYVVSKVISAFAGGYLVTLLGFLLSVFGMALLIRCEYHGEVRSFAGGEQTVWMVEYMVCISFLGALMSVVGLAVTTVLPNFFVGMAMPILIYYLWLSLDAWFAFPQFLTPRCYFVYENTLQWGSRVWQLLYAFLFTCVLSWLLYGFCCRTIQRRLEND
ncbi:MAG: hypothetical protein HDQ95_11290 [Roseburia sp.]|nr:hypothetical protein [Roseburia sp.]